MAKQDEWVRITLRLPADLHARITDAAGPNSLNAEIVSTLEEAYPAKDAFDELHSYINRGIDMINAMPEGRAKEEARVLMVQQIRVASQRLGSLEAELRKLLGDEK